MLAWLDDLTPPGSWRDAEEAAMGLFADLLEARIPPLSGVTSAVALRRIGYLLELAALRSDPPLADRLAAEADLVRRRLACAADPGIKPVGLFGPARRGPCHDEIALRWGLAAGLDLARFASFRAAMPAKAPPEAQRTREKTI